VERDVEMAEIYGVRCEGCGVRYEELRAQGSEQRVEKKTKSGTMIPSQEGLGVGLRTDNTI
jgi:hypothetical protein